MNRSPLASMATAMHTVSLAAALFIAPSCAAPPASSTAALDALDDIHRRVLAHETDATETTAALAETVCDAAAERLRLALLLDLDALQSAAGRPDEALIERLLREGSDNAVVEEIRSGRLSPEQALRLVSDAAAAADLSPEPRQAAEQRLIERFAPWQRLQESRRALLEGLESRSAAARVLLDEAVELTAAVRSATAARRAEPMRWRAAAIQTSRLIEDQQLRSATRELIEALMPAQDAQANTTTRSNDQ